MRGQVYRLRMSQENFENAKPGHMVFESDGNEFVTGFVSAIDTDRFEMEMCLFDPSDNLPPNVLRVVKEEITEKEMSDMLRSALDQNPAMKEHWAKLIQDSV